MKIVESLYQSCHYGTFPVFCIVSNEDSSSIIDPDETREVRKKLRKQFQNKEEIPELNALYNSMAEKTKVVKLLQLSSAMSNNSLPLQDLHCILFR